MTMLMSCSQTHSGSSTCSILIVWFLLVTMLIQLLLCSAIAVLAVLREQQNQHHIIGGVCRVDIHHNGQLVLQSAY